MAMTLEEKRARRRERQEQAARMERIYAENAVIVASGKCPRCGSPLKRNWSLTGWWMCEQRGAEQFRARPSEPECNFDCFVKE